MAPRKGHVTWNKTTTRKGHVRSEGSPRCNAKAPQPDKFQPFCSDAEASTKFLRFPVIDRGVPDSLEALDGLVLLKGRFAGEHHEE